ncbi:MAG: hypothetical protein EB101_02135 [Chitinophagia bacterium]|nr:hypothetical protein [Chitinophagia bacterium]
MKSQQYSNHVRYDPFWHFTAVPLTLTGLVASLVNLFRCSDENCFQAVLLALVFLILVVLVLLVRIYALKAQDRAIRAEEKLRFFVLTGKPLDSRLRMGQIIALRFASDDELPNLARWAAEESLTPAQIKQAIQHWRADLRRV